MNPIAIAAAKALVARCEGKMTPARVRSILSANGIGASDEDIAERGHRRNHETPAEEEGENEEGEQWLIPQA
jgi:hypothetical protein